MLENHTTREGDTLLIAQMNDDHLKRMIRLILRTVNEIREKSQQNGIDPYQSALYGLRKIEPEDAARLNREAIRKLYPYLAEAFLRGFDDLRDDLIESIGREQALPHGLPALPSVVIYDNDEEPF